MPWDDAGRRPLSRGEPVGKEARPRRFYPLPSPRFIRPSVQVHRRPPFRHPPQCAPPRPPSQVGCVDSIIDVVACAAGLDWLGPLSGCWVSPLPMGRGPIRGAAHGPLPGPPPAVVAVLAGSGVSTTVVPAPATTSSSVGASSGHHHRSAADAELVTPTGACLAAAVASWDFAAGRRLPAGSGAPRCATWPPVGPGGWHVDRVGYGAGTGRWADRANLVRLVAGGETPTPAEEGTT